MLNIARIILKSTKSDHCFESEKKHDCCVPITVYNLRIFTVWYILQAFLSMYVDDSVTGSNVRRRSTTEDDNPPSPVDTMDVFNLSQQNPTGSGSPGSRGRDGGGARFHSPMTSPNPHTPASPGPRMSGVRVR